MTDHTDDTILDEELDENDFNFDNENEDALLAETDYDFVQKVEISEDRNEQLEPEEDVLDIGIADEDIVDSESTCVQETIIVKQVTENDEFVEQKDEEETICDPTVESTEKTEAVETYVESGDTDANEPDTISSSVCDDQVKSSTTSLENDLEEKKDEKPLSKSTFISLRKAVRKSYDNVPDLAKVIELVQPGVASSRSRKYSNRDFQSNGRKKQHVTILRHKNDYDDRKRSEHRRHNRERSSSDYHEEEFSYMSDEERAQQSTMSEHTLYECNENYVNTIRETVPFAGSYEMQSEPHFIPEFPQHVITSEQPIVASVQITQERYQITGDFQMINSSPNIFVPPSSEMSFCRPPSEIFQKPYMGECTQPSTAVRLMPPPQRASFSFEQHLNPRPLPPQSTFPRPPFHMGQRPPQPHPPALSHPPPSHPFPSLPPHSHPPPSLPAPPHQGPPTVHPHPHQPRIQVHSLIPRPQFNGPPQGQLLPPQMIQQNAAPRPPPPHQYHHPLQQQQQQQQQHYHHQQHQPQQLLQQQPQQQQQQQIHQLNHPPPQLRPPPLRQMHPPNHLRPSPHTDFHRPPVMRMPFPGESNSNVMIRQPQPHIIQNPHLRNRHPSENAPRMPPPFRPPHMGPPPQSQFVVRGPRELTPNANNYYEEHVQFTPNVSASESSFQSHVNQPSHYSQPVIPAQPPPPGCPTSQHQMRPVFPPAEHQFQRSNDEMNNYSQYSHRQDYYLNQPQPAQQCKPTENYGANDETSKLLKRNNSSLHMGSPSKQARYDYSSVKKDEDEELQLYRKKVESQKKLREKFVQLKEEQRLKNQMQSFIQNNIKGILQKREQFLRKTEAEQLEKDRSVLKINENTTLPVENDRYAIDEGSRIQTFARRKYDEPARLERKYEPVVVNDTNQPKVSRNENIVKIAETEAEKKARQLHKVVKIKYKDGTVALKSIPVHRSSSVITMPHSNVSGKNQNGDNMNIIVNENEFSSNLNVNHKRKVVSKHIPLPNVKNELSGENIIIESVRKGVTQSSVPLAQRFSNLRTSSKDEKNETGMKAKNRLVIPDDERPRTAWTKSIQKMGNI